MRKIVAATSVFALVLGVAARGGEPKAPEPGPEHKKFQDFVGTWDCTCEHKGKTSSGTMTYKVGLGGLWLLEHFQGEFEGKKFEGMGCMSYDAAKKAYVSAWVDSMSTSPMISEGNFDKSGKKMTMKGQMPMPDGKTAASTMVTEIKDKNNMVMTMSCDFGGKEPVEMMKISLKRREK
jgi:hypothetical protein